MLVIMVSEGDDDGGLTSVGSGMVDERERQHRGVKLLFNKFWLLMATRRERGFFWKGEIVIEL